MPKDKGKDDGVLKIAMIIAALGLLSVVGYWGYIQANTDNNCNGVSALFDRNDNSGTSFCGDNATAKNSNHNITVITKPGQTPPPGGLPTITITGISIDNTLLAKGERLEPMLYILPPGTDIKETVRFRVSGAAINGVTFSFNLLPGTLNLGVARHLPGDAPLAEDKVTKDTLIASQNEYAVTLKGRVPAYNPGHDWYLPIIEISAPGMETPLTQTNWRDDDPTKPKWLTLAYPNDWRDIPVETKIQVVDTTLSGDGMDIAFVQSALIGVKKQIDHGTIYEITYAGKDFKVFDGQLPLCAESQNILKTILGACVLQLGETSQVVKIPARDMASVGPNEAYMKITLYDVDGNAIDLNTASNDMAARVNIDQQVVGGKSFEGSEYFSVFGARGLMPFSVFGGAGHPEQNWFK